MEIAEFLERIQRAREYQGQIVFLEKIPGRSARYGEPRLPLTEHGRRILKQLGIARLYTHQCQAIDLIRQGENVAIVTSTASGKTLCYNLPVMEELHEDRRLRAMYIFPTKALAQDQLRKLRELDVARELFCATYDGDTEQSQRPTIRKTAHIVLTNPDMLHVGILPNHSAWASFFARLRYVVLDEVHMYRGVFGSHTANIMRRLRRICQRYGAQPQFVCCSATIANPGELTERLLGTKMHVVAEDGSPAAARYFAVWNPPELVRGEQAFRRSAYTEAAYLLAKLAQAEIRTITFVRARKIAELVLRRTRNILRNEAPELADKLMSYRGGYLPAERREIERKLFCGELLGVCSTTALEVGVDIGGLDACVMVGYPGSIASLWQQSGRAGRGEREALTVLIALNSTLDQYVARHPEFLLQAPTERATVDPENRFILAGHLLAGAKEEPLREEELPMFGEETGGVLGVLAEHDLVARRDRWYFTGDFDPAPQINIRSAAGQAYEIVNLENDELLGTVDADSAFYHVHPGAVYLHQGETYLVQRLDIEERRAYVRPARVNYYTEPRWRSEVRVAEKLAARTLGELEVSYGEVVATVTWHSFARLHELGGHVLSEEPLDLPPKTIETCGLWFALPEKLQRIVRRGGGDLLGAMHAIEHVCIAMLPLVAMCEPLDVAGASHHAHPDLGAPAVFIYDAYPGGVGMAEQAYERFEEVLQAALRTVTTCPCQAPTGCPACVQSPFCGDNNQPLDREWAGRLLEEIVRSAQGQ